MTDHTKLPEPVYPYKKVKCRSCNKNYTINKVWEHHDEHRCPTCEFKHFRSKGSQ